MAYILFVNPQILSAAGMDRGAVFMATAIAAALTTLLMGLYANLPVALAPGMGQNAYFAFTVVPLLAGDWRLALGCVFISGILFVAISASPGARMADQRHSPKPEARHRRRHRFFLALIGFEGAGWVKASSATLLQPGNLADPKALIAAGGLLVIAALWARKVTGAVLIGILAATVASLALGLQPPARAVGARRPPSRRPSCSCISPAALRPARWSVGGAGVPAARPAGHLRHPDGGGQPGRADARMAG